MVDGRFPEEREREEALRRKLVEEADQADLRAKADQRIKDEAELQKQLIENNRPLLEKMTRIQLVDNDPEIEKSGAEILAGILAKDRIKNPALMKHSDLSRAAERAVGAAFILDELKQVEARKQEAQSAIASEQPDAVQKRGFEAPQMVAQAAEIDRQRQQQGRYGVLNDLSDNEGQKAEQRANESDWRKTAREILERKRLTDPRDGRRMRESLSPQDPPPHEPVKSALAYDYSGTQSKKSDWRSAAREVLDREQAKSDRQDTRDNLQKGQGLKRGGMMP